MRVLDIDLDFFLADCCPLAELGERPSLPGHEPWEASAVRAFLENQCGLSRTAPKPGRIFETHDGALRFWEEQIAAGRLTAPFDVTHVDAHSDLGIGYPGPNFVLFNVLSMPVQKRLDYAAFYAQKKLDEANYLLFALAMRRISSLDNVRNPRSRADIPQVLLDADGNIHTDTYQVPYDYYICTVTLENFNLSHVPVYIMSEEQLGMYATYMATLGNRPDLFPGSGYIGKYVEGSYTDYDIPPEALDDEVFAAIIKEAEKYLGYPYVWGGSSPSTSFDCSGFVSWVINHSGWDVGRLGAQGLCNICTPVSSANVKPGDLVFFTGTYDTPGVSHVGIYVGNNMMIHCGDPISYANLNSSYWQSHFYRYGRLP
mgnify:CR=1 FL=1